MFLSALLAIIEGEENKIWFEKLYYEYEDTVRGYSLKKLNNNKEFAEDNAHDVFTHLAQNFEKLKTLEGKKLRVYILTITNSLAINKYNKEILRSPISVDEEEYFEIEDKTSFEDFGEADIKMAISKVLTEEEQSYIYLSAVYGYSSKEIGKLYGISDALVRKRLQFIRAKCRKYLGEMNGQI